MPGTVMEAAERVDASTGLAVERASARGFVLETMVPGPVFVPVFEPVPLS